MSLYRNWQNSPDEVARFARDMVHSGYMTAIDSLVEYIEKPRKWSKEHAWWEANGESDEASVWAYGMTHEWADDWQYQIDDDYWIRDLKDGGTAIVYEEGGKFGAEVVHGPLDQTEHKALRASLFGGFDEAADAVDWYEGLDDDDVDAAHADRKIYGGP